MPSSEWPATRVVANSLAGNLRVLEEVWEAQPNRSVLLVKWAPFYGGACSLCGDDAKGQLHDFGCVGTARSLAGPFGAEVLTPRQRK